MNLNPTNKTVEAQLIHEITSFKWSLHETFKRNSRYNYSNSCLLNEVGFAPHSNTLNDKEL